MERQERDYDNCGISPPFIEEPQQLRSDKIHWKLFNVYFIISHMWLNHGSAHILLRHWDNFEFMTQSEAKKLESIKKVYNNENMSRLDRELSTQRMITNNPTFFKTLEKKLLQYLETIINNSKQTFITFDKTKLAFYFQFQKGDEIKYLKLITADGSTEYEERGFKSSLKLITAYINPLNRLGEQIWYEYEKCYFCSSTDVNKYGIFIQFDEDSIHNETFHKLFRDGNEEYSGQSEIGLKKILRSNLNNFEIHSKRMCDEDQESVTSSISGCQSRKKRRSMKKMLRNEEKLARKEQNSIQLESISMQVEQHSTQIHTKLEESCSGRLSDFDQDGTIHVGTPIECRLSKEPHTFRVQPCQLLLPDPSPRNEDLLISNQEPDFLKPMSSSTFRRQRTISEKSHFEKTVPVLLTFRRLNSMQEELMKPVFSSSSRLPNNPSYF